MEKPAIEVRFEKPTGGYWDGGLKSGGVFTPRVVGGSDFHKKCEIEWGCWELNFWFICKSGLSWKHAASIARNRIANSLRVAGTVSVV